MQIKEQKIQFIIIQCPPIILIFIMKIIYEILETKRIELGFKK